MKNYFGFTHASSFPLNEGQLFYWSIMTAVECIKMSVRELEARQFFPNPSPLFYFHHFLVPTFSTNSHGNACYAPSFLVFLLSPQLSRRIRAETLATQAIAQSLTLVPRYFLLNRTETLATQAIKSTGKVPTSSVGTISKGFCFSSRFFPRGEGGGEVLRISSDRDGRMGAKIKTPKNPCGVKQNPKKPLDQNLTPKNPMPNFRAMKNSRGTTRPGYL